MSFIPIQQLLTTPTATSVRKTLVSALVSFGIPADQWVKAGALSTILTVIATFFGGLAGLITAGLSAAFLGVATGPWLVLLAYYVYGVTANQATFAVAPVKLTNTGGGSYTKAAGSVTVACSATGVQYTNLDPFTLSPSSNVTVNFQALVAGSVGNANAGPGPGSIDTLVTPMLGVTVVNTAPAIGLDADPDALVVQKCQAATAARSYKGPKGAYYFAVFTAKNGAIPVNINRVQVYRDPTSGQIFVYVASPTGIVTPGDLAAAQTAVTQIAQPFGITATVVACAIYAWSPNVVVYATGAGTLDPVALESAVASAMSAYLSAYPIGGFIVPPSTTGYVYATGVVGSIEESNAAIFRVDGLSDLALAPEQVVTVTPSITVRLQ